MQVTHLLSSEEIINIEFTPFFRIHDKYDVFVITADRFDFSQNGIKHLNIVYFLIGDEI